MLSPLNERLDEVGWSNKDDWKEHTGLIFKWMQQATAEIERLESVVSTLRKQVPDNR